MKYQANRKTVDRNISVAFSIDWVNRDHVKNIPVENIILWAGLQDNKGYIANRDDQLFCVSVYVDGTGLFFNLNDVSILKQGNVKPILHLLSYRSHQDLQLEYRLTSTRCTNDYKDDTIVCVSMWASNLQMQIPSRTSTTMESIIALEYQKTRYIELGPVTVLGTKFLLVTGLNQSCEQRISVKIDKRDVSVEISRPY